MTYSTRYDVELYQRIEHLLGKKLDAYPCEEDTVLIFMERVADAQRIAATEMKEIESKKRGKQDRSHYAKKGKYNK